MLEAGERLVDGDQRNLGDGQDLFIIGKVLKYSKNGSPDYFYRKALA